MKKVLPILISLVFVLSFLFSFAPLAHAALTTDPADVPNPERWVPDSNVTFVGKTADRSREFLDLTLRNYDWACVTRNATTKTCNNTDNPLAGYWAIIRNIIYAILIVVVLVAAFVMIATRGRSLTITRFIPRFILIIVFITLSFSIVQFLYQIADIIQGFFLRFGDGADRHIITTRDLIFIGFDYKNFTGLRLPGPENDESAFMTLLLVRLTALTYYVMTGVLILRKIILWFFIILSPVFPILLFFRPVRNTAKIWIGEFFRWLLYGPLFAIFLNGLVTLWSSQKGIPLGFDYAKVGDAAAIVYPTAVNILIGGPGQQIGIDNSANLQDTFALYVVALIMLWVVIILPFILLKIFLDYATGINLQNNQALRQVWNKFSPILPPPGTPPTGPSPVPPPAGAGLALKIPFFTGNGKTIAVPNPVGDYRGEGRARAIPTSTGLARSIPTSRSISANRSIPTIARIPENAHILQLANLSVPRLTDIARYEKIMETRDISKSSEVTRITSSLEKISNPNIISSTVERDRYSQVKQELVKQRDKGNILATSILRASNVVNTSNVSRMGMHSSLSQTSNFSSQSSLSNVSNRAGNSSQSSSSLSNASNVSNQYGAPVTTQQTTNISNTAPGAKDTFTSMKENNTLSQTTNTLGQKAGITTPSSVHLPTVNKVQQVSIEDYEEVKKMWQDTYETSNPPTDLNGKKATREEWINGDVNSINQAITLLNSVDPTRVTEGMEMVSNILPFLMVGGFSKTEVIAYLKAKLEAAKQVLSSGDKKKEDEDTLLDRNTNATHAEKHLTTQAEAENDEEKTPNELETEKDPLAVSSDEGEKKLEELRKKGEGV